MIEFFDALTKPKTQIAVILVLVFLLVLVDATILLGLVALTLVVIPPQYDPVIRWKLEQENKGPQK